MKCMACDLVSGSIPDSTNRVNIIDLTSFLPQLDVSIPLPEMLVIGDGI